MTSSYKRKVRIPYNEILNRLNNKYGNKITLITTEKNYKGTHYECEFKCNSCDYIFKQKINKILSKNYSGGCNNCLNINRKILKKDDVELQLQNKQISIISKDDELLNDRTYKFLCLECDYIWTAKLRNILTGKKCCKKCTGHYNYNIDEIKNMLICNNNKINILENSYISISKPATFECAICNNVWNVRAHNVVNGITGCPKCKKSHGEKLVEDFLSYLMIKNLLPIHL